MLDSELIKTQLGKSPLADISVELIEITRLILKSRSHGLLNHWLDSLDALPDARPSVNDFNSPVVKIGQAGDLNDNNKDKLTSLLHGIHPWRKGPFNLFGIAIDSEWRSDLKWTRLQNHIQNLNDRLILDVGCGNGYYIYRMLGMGARFVLGIEPSQLFVAQFNSIKKYTPDIPAVMLPLRTNELPFKTMAERNIGFDTVFSMGILYHRKNQTEHLRELWDCLKPGGELVLETLIVENKDTLIPKTTYAKMSNVWSIPSEKILIRMLEQCGFSQITTIDISRTTVKEQRKTEWMTFESLSDFLDPRDAEKTIEGHPVPTRIIILATK